MRPLITLSLLALSTVAARADITYYYTGQDFTSGNTKGSITGYMTLASPFGDNLNNAAFGLTAFSFTDGTATITNTNNTVVFTFLLMSTDASGHPTHWTLDFEAGPAGSGLYTWELSIASTGDFSAGEYTTTGPSFFDSNSVAGSFSLTPPGTSAVPEPSGMVLLMTVLGGAFIVVRKTRVGA